MIMIDADAKVSSFPKVRPVKQTQIRNIIMLVRMDFPYKTELERKEL